MTALKVLKRASAARGKGSLSWLESYHTFSFADYYDPGHQSFGPLRVINEDKVAPAHGFSAHPHRSYLIWSYVVSGVLAHKDSMGYTEELRRGQVQFTRAGSGIMHSEMNGDRRSSNNGGQKIHLLQIWARAYPEAQNAEPAYRTVDFPDEIKRNKLATIVESVGRLDRHDGKTAPKPIQAETDLTMEASILQPGNSVTHQVVTDGERKLYVHVVMTSADGAKENTKAKIQVGDQTLEEGDGAFIHGAGKAVPVEVKSVGGSDAEFVLFDMGD